MLTLVGCIGGSPTVQPIFDPDEDEEQEAPQEEPDNEDLIPEYPGGPVRVYTLAA